MPLTRLNRDADFDESLPAIVDSAPQAGQGIPLGKEILSLAVPVLGKGTRHKGKIAARLAAAFRLEAP